MEKREDLLNNKIKAFYKSYYRETLGLPDWQKKVENRLSEERHEREYLRRLEELAGKLAGKKLLNVGCGTGGFNMVALDSKVQAFGLDVDKEAIDICRLKAELKGFEKEYFLKESAEALPFPDDYFDVVYTFSVLEHLQDLEQSLKEIKRVLKKDGLLFINAPDYSSCYEGHYKIFWIPNLPKKMAKAYLKLRGRPSEFLDSLNFITKKEILEKLQRLGLEIIFQGNLRKPAWSFRNLLPALHSFITGVTPVFEVAASKK